MKPRVKKLEFQPSGERWWQVLTPFCRISVRKHIDKDRYSITKSTPGYSDWVTDEYFDTLESAQAAAQAWFDEQILSCLEV